MNKQQKELLQLSLNSEKEVLKQLEKNYKDALDEVTTRIALLKMREDADMQHVIYQLDYQRQLKSQIETILEQLHNNNFDTVSEYLTNCYEQGFIGTMYEIQGQGVPLVFPIDQELVVEAIQHETQLSESLYATLGKDTKVLSKQIAAEISRGISNNAMYSEMARNLAGYAGISKNNAMRIARTEGHRIQNKAIAHAQEKARDCGADIVKVWSAALDGKTRPHHRELDGQIRELDEPFEIMGLSAQEPGGFGVASEDINCRCRRNGKARWLLDEEETKHLGNTEKMTDEQLQPIADKLGIDVDELRKYKDQIIPVKARNYDDFRRQYENLTNYNPVNREDVKRYMLTSYGKNPTIKEKLDMKKTVKSYPQKVQDALSDVKIKIHSKDGSGYYPRRNMIVYADEISYAEKAHEVGHAIEGKLFDKAEVDKLKRKCVEGLGRKDIKVKTGVDSSGNKRKVFVVKSDKFLSDYQGLLYADSIEECLDADGNIDISKMEEFISVAFEKYMVYPKYMKKHFQEMYDLVKDSVE